MSDARRQRLELEVSLAIRNFLEAAVSPVEHFHTITRHSPLCLARITEDIGACDCEVAIEIHRGRHGDCASCHVWRH
jgi:hypothetical protein